jgi:hypothetical protein
MRDYFIQGSYIIASVLFIMGLRSLTRPDKARHGMQLAAVGMLFAIAGTLFNHTIIDYRWITGGLILGIVIGYPMGMWVPMTAMPQRIALSRPSAHSRPRSSAWPNTIRTSRQERPRRISRWERWASRSCSAPSRSAARWSRRASCKSGLRPSR